MNSYPNDPYNQQQGGPFANPPPNNNNYRQYNDQYNRTSILTQNPNNLNQDTNKVWSTKADPSMKVSTTMKTKKMGYTLTPEMASSERSILYSSFSCLQPQESEPGGTAVPGSSKLSWICQQWSSLWCWQ